MREQHIFSSWFIYDQEWDHEEDAEPVDVTDESVDEGDSLIDPSRVPRNASAEANGSAHDGH